MILFIVYVDMTHTTKESTASIRTCEQIPCGVDPEPCKCTWRVHVPDSSIHERTSLFL